MIVQFWDKNRPDLVMEDSRAKRLFEHINANSPKFVDFSDWGYGMLAAREVKGFIPGNDTASAMNKWNGQNNTPPTRLPEYLLEVSNHKPLDPDESIERIRAMKEKFLKRKEKEDENGTN